MRIRARLQQLPSGSKKPHIPPSLSGTTCETFWEVDPLTDSCYQFNFQATLSWTEAWISCQQQGADLLSITKLHEQTYINGAATFTSIPSLINAACEG